jgi:hypothetical protein
LKPFSPKSGPPYPSRRTTRQVSVMTKRYNDHKNRNLGSVSAKIVMFFSPTLRLPTPIPVLGPPPAPYRALTHSWKKKKLLAPPAHQSPPPHAWGRDAPKIVPPDPRRLRLLWRPRTSSRPLHSCSGVASTLRPRCLPRTESMLEASKSSLPRRASYLLVRRWRWAMIGVISWLELVVMDWLLVAVQE